MARFDRLTVLKETLDSGLVPIFYDGDPEIATEVVLACASGGARVIEFTNRGDFAPQVFLELARTLAVTAPQVILGVGSVVDAPTAAQYIGYGANFIVGPNFNPEVARLCNRRKVAYSPGCATASEIGQAEEMGVEIVKVFPASCVGGTDFIKAVHGPCPWTRIMPTGVVDVTEADVKSWIKAGAACLGVGAKLITPALLQDRQFDSLASQTAQLIRWIREARGLSLYTGVEHVGLYATANASMDALTDWYTARFGFQVEKSMTHLLTLEPQVGRIEVMPESAPLQAHVAIGVTDFDAASRDLVDRGLELEDPIISPAFKLRYLKEDDPAGNRVHIIQRMA